CDGESIASLEYDHVLQLTLRMRAKLFERDDPVQLLYELNIDDEPARGFRFAGGIVVIVLGIELRFIGISLANHLHDPGDAGHRAARVIEEGEVARLHIVLEEVARLKIANSVPCARLILHPSQM